MQFEGSDRDDIHANKLRHISMGVSNSRRLKQIKMKEG
jgi:hypothetical protein